MPDPPAILHGLTAIANAWRPLAIVWHLLLAAAAVATLAGWRPAARTAGRLLIAPLIAVGALAWRSGNPFNGTVFAVLALALGWITTRMRSTPPVPSSGWIAAPGVLIVGFGAGYPHFVHAASWVEYLYAAPLGLLPCPTLSAIIGVTLILDRLESKAWSLTVASAGLLYGAIGAFRLGVAIDAVLLAGAMLLIAAALRRDPVNATRIP